MTTNRTNHKWPTASLALLFIGCLFVLGFFLSSERGTHAQEGTNTQKDLNKANASGGKEPATSGIPQSTTEPKLQAYPTRREEVLVKAALWRKQFGSTPGVRIVGDERSSQVLVLAPPEVHRMIASGGNRFPALNGNPATPTRIQSSTQTPIGPMRPAAVTQGPRTQYVEQIDLKHLSPQRLEVVLRENLPGRLTAIAGQIPTVSKYQLRLSEGGSVILSIDRTTNRVDLFGNQSAVNVCTRLIGALDTSQVNSAQSTRLVSLRATRPAAIRQTMEAIRLTKSVGQGRAGNTQNPGQGSHPLLAMLNQQAAPPEGAAGANPPMPGQRDPKTPPAKVAPPDQAPPPDQAAPPEEGGGLIGPVQIELLEGLDVLVIRGHRRDVDQVMEIINQIEKLSTETAPDIRVYLLRHVDSVALSELVTQIYTDVFAVRQGTVSITALVKPNALLLIGRTEAVGTVVDLIKRLDRPVDPATQFQVFRLQHTSAEMARTQIEEFFNERGGLGTRVRVTSDFRSNTLIVQASPRDMAEITQIVNRLDTGVSEAVNELRLFRLQHSLASELAPILQEAMNGQGIGASGRSGLRSTGRSAGPTSGTSSSASRRTTSEGRSSMLQLMTIDTNGGRNLKSGILSDVSVTADPRANALLVSAPAASMPLIEALIKQLDQLPAAEAQIKVFTIVNGDAVGLVEMLDTLFSTSSQGTGNQGSLPPVISDRDNSLVSLHFGVDARTNSIIASGSTGDLTVVEAILLRLDESDVRNRKSTVYRLQNAPAADVAEAINEFLSSERQVQESTPGLFSSVEQIEREVVVVPESVSNSLIVSATPRFFDEIAQIVQQLDERPPMVMIQVLIAEVALNDTDEFGVELGLQDSILFDRSILGDLQSVTQTIFDEFGNPTTTNQQVLSATNTPGFLFNNQELGNSGSEKAMANSNVIGTQGLSHFELGRTNNELGYGGLVLSASSESVSILIRALKECRDMRILGRPQIMTLDKQPAFIQVGQRVPRITGTQINQTGQVNTVTLEDVGLILDVTPRVSPDGMIVMEINAEKSDLGPEAEGIPISISASGEVIRSPQINTTKAETVVSATSGQTVVLGGLITKSKTDVHRRIPLLSDIPILGNLFRYDLEQGRRTELMIIMTPRIVQSEADAEAIKQIEAARMHWCLSDVIELHDDISLRTRNGDWSDVETSVFYPGAEDGPSMIPNRSHSQPTVAPVPNQTPFYPKHAPALENNR